jgi:hypothetical protein
MLIMGLEPKDFARLERDASSMGTANHGRYLSDAMLAMRDPAFAADRNDAIEAPLRALRLLDVMWGGVHALRPDQRVALNDVGVWLETRLSREPDAKVNTLLVELGWLKRLARHHQSMQEDNRKARAVMPGRGNQKAFGRRLVEIDCRRREAFAKAARVEVSERQAVIAEAAKPKGPEPLPATLAVQFERYEPGRKDTAVRALVGALDGGVERRHIVTALSKVDKRHRGALVEATRAALHEKGRAMLDDVVAAMNAAVEAPAEPKVVVQERPRESVGPRAVRVRLEVDAKAPKRFFLHIEGEKKPLKSAVVEMDEVLLAELRANGDWVEVVVVRDGAKVKVQKKVDA